MTTTLEALVDDLHDRGFDLSGVQETEDYAFCVRVGCSQCRAIVIQGIACHELSCPNARRDDGKEENEEES